MAIVITNGIDYVAFDTFINQSQNSGIRKTKNITDAYNFTLVSDAIKVMKRSTKKTKDYYVFDTFTNRILWKRMTQEEIIQAQEDKLYQTQIKRNSNGKLRERYILRTQGK